MRRDLKKPHAYLTWHCSWCDGLLKPRDANTSTDLECAPCGWLFTPDETNGGYRWVEAERHAHWATGTDDTTFKE